MQSLASQNLKDKVVLLRVDFNVPIQDGLVLDSSRIEASLPTINLLLKGGAKVVLLTHVGRPNGKKDMSFSTKVLIPEIERITGRGVLFVQDCVGKSALEVVKKAAKEEIVLLENVRFYKEEEDGDLQFAKKLASLADVYVNDAFSCSHRSHASIVQIAGLLPSFAGENLRKEVSSLEFLNDNSDTNNLVIIGGSKVSTKINALNNLMQKAKVLAVVGAMANTFLRAKGFQVGKSLVEEGFVDTAKQILAKAFQHGCEIMLPSSVVVAKSLDKNCKNRVVKLSAQQNNVVYNDEMILDVGFETILNISNAALKSQVVLWNGPLGVFETSPYDAGSIQLARNLAQYTQEGKIKSIAGGGDTIAAIAKSNLTSEFSYISTAGGAFLEFLEGNSLVGIKALL